MSAKQNNLVAIDLAVKPEGTHGRSREARHLDLKQAKELYRKHSGDDDEFVDTTVRDDAGRAACRVDAGVKRTCGVAFDWSATLMGRTAERVVRH